MEDKEIPAGSYKQLTSVEETTEDELPLHSNQEQRGTETTEMITWTVNSLLVDNRISFC